VTFEHYDGVLNLSLTEAQRKDVEQYLLSL
jgi:hypothetical protein